MRPVYRAAGQDWGDKKSGILAFAGMTIQNFSLPLHPLARVAPSSS